VGYECVRLCAPHKDKNASGYYYKESAYVADMTDTLLDSITERNSVTDNSITDHSITY
jgi:hypothetical protein